MESLSAWESFYVIVGSSAAALTGLQFVVVALVVDVRKGTSLREMDAFATPTIVHFCAVLLASAVLSAPWPSIVGPTINLAVLGAAGMIYALIVTRRSATQTGYTPVLEDRIFHHILPFVAYGVLAIAAVSLRRHTHTALFWIGGTTLLLLFIGIHNAWDTVTWIASGGQETRSSGEKLTGDQEVRRQIAGERSQGDPEVRR